MRKKVVATLLCLSLMIGTLTGCGSNNKTSEPVSGGKESSVSTIQRNRSLGLCRRSAGKEHKLIVSGKQTANRICVLEEEAPLTNTCRGLAEAQQQIIFL